MELQDMIGELSKLGCETDQEEIAERLYSEGQMGDLVKCLKKFRCDLVDEMHQSQRKVDKIDLIIRKAEKETMERIGG
jgi:hypothetical protein